MSYLIQKKIRPKSELITLRENVIIKYLLVYKKVVKYFINITQSAGGRRW